MNRSRSPRVDRSMPVKFAATVRPTRWLLILGLLVVSWACDRPALAQAARSGSRFYPNDSEDAERLLRNAANQARDRQWKESIDLYQKVIERFGEKVARVPKVDPATPGEFELYVDGRKYCHGRIAELPPEARAIYRERVDSMARRWYEQGLAGRDPELLRRVVSEAFCSSWGDEALDLLGDLAFQNGRFGEALSYYGQLVPDRPGDSGAMVHPDPSVDLAKVAAKQWLCRAAEGHLPGPSDLAALAARYPGASGSLAGRNGSYVAIVKEAVAGDRLSMGGQPDGRWPTFAGAPNRTRILPGPIDVGQVQWRVELEKVATGKGGLVGIRPSAASQARPAALLAYHPIVLGDQVLVCDGSKVLAYNLSDRPADAETGEPRPVLPAWRHDPEGQGVVRATQAPSSIPRYTLTTFGRRIFARMGSAGMVASTFRPRPISAEPGNSSIVALDWDTQGKLLWEVRSINLELPHRQGGRMAATNFEGSPVADGRNVYAAITDHGQQTMIYVACFDAETGEKKWIRYLGTATPEPDLFQNAFGMQTISGPTPGDYRHRLLSLDGSTLYYQTNLGAVIAIEAETGSIQWVATYPRQEINRFGQPGDRDLNPAVVDDGRVMVAPADSDVIYAFDSGSGRLLWKTEPIADDVKLAHVLGVARGRLVVTGDRVLLFDVKNGKLAGAWPDAANKSLEGYGRGLLAGDLIYWPTQREIQVLDQRTGLKAGPPIMLAETYHTEGGNLAAGDGYLIVAQSDGLVVFCQNSRLIDRYRREIVEAPARAGNYYRLARAAEATGRDELALASYRETIEKARPDETIDGIPLAGAARDHLFRMRILRAARLRREREWGRAVVELESAFEVARTDPDRLEARLLLSEVQLDADRPAEAVDALESVLLDPRLRPLPVAADDGRRTIRADLLVSDRLASILRTRGRAAYASYDKRASELLERGRKEKDMDLLDQVGRDYPAARVVPEALRELAALEESSGRMSEATRAYRRLLTSGVDDHERAEALWALARIYDARRLHVSARDAYLELATRYPGLHPKSGGASYADRVERVLATGPYPRLLSDRHRSPPSPPMFRRWHRSSSAERAIRALSTEGVVPSLDASRIVLSERETLRMIDASDGSTSWSARIGTSVTWAGYLVDRLIVGGPGQVVALDLSTGAVQWRYRPGNTAGDTGSGARPDPFAAVEASTGGLGSGGPRPELNEFRLVKGRVFCLKGKNELVALDGETGAVDWSFTAARPGSINPHIWVGPERIVLNVDKPNQLLVLRTEDGRPMVRRPLAEPERLERPALPVDDDSALVVIDPKTVRKLDLNTGQFTWEYRESDVLPARGPPCLLGGGGLVLILHEGRTLIRLDPATGSKRWSCLLGLEDMSRRPAAMAFDETRFYCVSRFRTEVTLRAIDLRTGDASWTEKWTTSAEDSVWSLSLAPDHVVAYPRLPAPGQGVDLETVPVIVRRRETGALVQRLVFPAGNRAADLPEPGEVAEAVTFNPDQLGAVIATPRGLWGLGARDR